MLQWREADLEAQWLSSWAEVEKNPNIQNATAWLYSARESASLPSSVFAKSLLDNLIPIFMSAEKQRGYKKSYEGGTGGF